MSSPSPHDLGIAVREELQPREALYISDEVFFTGTAAEITPIRSVDRITIGTGGRGPITEAIQRHFFDIVRGREPDTHGGSPTSTRVPNPRRQPRPRLRTRVA